MKVPQAWSPRSCSSRKYCIVNITLQPTLSQAAKDVVLAPKPVISDDTSGLEPAVLQQLLAQIGSLASVYHKPADSFVSRQRLAVARAEELQVRVKGFAFVCCVFVCAGGGGVKSGCSAASGSGWQFCAQRNCRWGPRPTVASHLSALPAQLLRAWFGECFRGELVAHHIVDSDLTPLSRPVISSLLTSLLTPPGRGAQVCGRRRGHQRRRRGEASCDSLLCLGLPCHASLLGD